MARDLLAHTQSGPRWFVPGSLLSLISRVWTTLLWTLFIYFANVIGLF